jgi:hypothetical protein
MEGLAGIISDFFNSIDPLQTSVASPNGEQVVISFRYILTILALGQ